MLQSETYIPYARIGGVNLNDENILPSIIGSTNPDDPTDVYGNGLSISWRLPGGIVGIQYMGEGLWGYAVTPQGMGCPVNTDTTVRNWLMGGIENVEPPAKQYDTSEELDEAISQADPQLVQIINDLIIDYADRLLGGDAQHDEFKKYFSGCYRAI